MGNQHTFRSLICVLLIVSFLLPACGQNKSTQGDESGAVSDPTGFGDTGSSVGDGNSTDGSGQIANTGNSTIAPGSNEASTSGLTDPNSPNAPYAGYEPLSLPNGYNYGGLLRNPNNLFPYDLNKLPSVSALIDILCRVHKIIGVPVPDRTKFVMSLYLRVLGRIGEPEGVAYWVNVLTDVYNQSLREQVALGFLKSEEHAVKLVKSYYRTFLRREAEQGGINSWKGFIMQGNAEHVVKGILASREYWRINKGAGNITQKRQNFVRALYRDLLGRGAAQWEVDHWVNVVASQGRYAVASGFVHSAEARLIAIDVMFAQFFGRAATPSERQNYLQLFNQGLNRISIAAKILASSEYLSRISPHFRRVIEGTCNN